MGGFSSGFIAAPFLLLLAATLLPPVSKLLA
jgi:hypothetical protein